MTESKPNQVASEVRKLKILFLCTGNTCRSQMAEGLTNHMKSGLIESYSAGVEPGLLNPLAVKSMAEIGIDISAHVPKTIESLGGIVYRIKNSI